MATTAKTRKPKGLAPTARARRAVKAIQTGGAGGSNGATVKNAPADKFAPGQKPLDTMGDVDERVPDLDRVCQKVIADKEAQRGKALDVAAGLEKVGKLLKEHDLDCYIVAGKKFVPVAGEPTVKIYKVRNG